MALRFEFALSPVSSSAVLNRVFKSNLNSRRFSFSCAKIDFPVESLGDEQSSNDHLESPCVNKANPNLNSTWAKQHLNEWIWRILPRSYLAISLSVKGMVSDFYSLFVLLNICFFLLGSRRTLISFRKRGRTKHMLVARGNFHASTAIVNILFLHFTCSRMRRAKREEINLVELILFRQKKRGKALVTH